jgi:hypothetical protein
MSQRSDTILSRRAPPLLHTRVCARMRGAQTERQRMMARCCVVWHASWHSRHTHTRTHAHTHAASGPLLWPAAARGAPFSVPPVPLVAAASVVRSLREA